MTATSIYRLTYWCTPGGTIDFQSQGNLFLLLGAKVYSFIIVGTHGREMGLIDPAVSQLVNI